jgi:spoIIIJ-associated protein
MDVEATIEIEQTDSSRPGESAPWLLNVSGSDMNALIGRRGETLGALQYITRLIASRKLQRRANIIVDIDGYKSRRSQQLRKLANRMADQALEQARMVTLEPMPPHERRIIHMALRNRDDVVTNSIGEGDSRKVTIVPK